MLNGKLNFSIPTQYNKTLSDHWTLTRFCPQRRVVWMWFGALPGAFGLGRAQPQRILQWYRQDSRRGFVHLILMRSNERQKHSGRLHFTLDNSIKSSSLSIMASQAEDTATYLCASDTQCSAGTCSPSTNLPELSLRSRDSVQSWWFCLLPTPPRACGSSWSTADGEQLLEVSRTGLSHHHPWRPPNQQQPL